MAGNNGQKKQNQRVSATAANIAATDASAVDEVTAPTVNAEIAVTTTSRPKKKTIAGKPLQKPASYAAAASATPSKEHANQSGSAIKQERPECPACDKGRHDLDYCREFRKKTDQDKRQFVLTQGICFNCLLKGHVASSCQEEAKCTKCKGRHNTILHEDQDRSKIASKEQ